MSKSTEIKFFATWPISTGIATATLQNSYRYFNQKRMETKKAEYCYFEAKEKSLKKRPFFSSKNEKNV